MREIDLTTWNPVGKRVLLYSGGVDSWLIGQKEIWNPDVKLFVNIGTNSAKGEIERLPEDVVIAELKDLHKLERKSDFILPLRNLYLIAMATNYGDEICLGANATDLTLDKTDEFAEKLSDLLTYMYQKQKWTEERKIKVTVEFRKYTKPELLKLYIDNGGDPYKAFNESYSCFTPLEDKSECRGCRACFLKLMAFIDNNIELPKDILKKYIPYIQKKLTSPYFNDRLYSKERYQEVLMRIGYYL